MCDRKKTEEQGQSSPRKQQNGNPKSFVFPPATSPEEISEAHRKVLAAHIRKMLENDDGGTLSFKQASSSLNFVKKSDGSCTLQGSG